MKIKNKKKKNRDMFRNTVLPSKCGYIINILKLVYLQWGYV